MMPLSPRILAHLQPRGAGPFSMCLGSLQRIICPSRLSTKGAQNKHAHHARLRCGLLVAPVRQELTGSTGTVHGRAITGSAQLQAALLNTFYDLSRASNGPLPCGQVLGTWHSQLVIPFFFSSEENGWLVSARVVCDGLWASLGRAPHGWESRDPRELSYPRCYPTSAL